MSSPDDTHKGEHLRFMSLGATTTSKGISEYQAYFHPVLANIRLATLLEQMVHCRAFRGSLASLPGNLKKE